MTVRTAPQPVRPGTADQLARLTHFRDLDLPEVDELDMVARFLIGDVGPAHEAPIELWDRVRDECRHLWHLLTDDWDDRDLDELTEAQYEASYFSTQQAEQDARHECTVARLTADIEREVWLARVQAADEARTVGDAAVETLLSLPR